MDLIGAVPRGRSARDSAPELDTPQGRTSRDDDERRLMEIAAEAGSLRWGARTEVRGPFRPMHLEGEVHRGASRLKSPRSQRVRRDGYWRPPASGGAAREVLCERHSCMPRTG